MNDYQEHKVELRWHEPKSSYDIVIVGGGGHGLATAYYLATRHGITDVCVIERDYIGGGNSGRNTTVIRSNYGIPEAVRFYQHSVDLYKALEDETNRYLMHQEKGILWLAHSQVGLQQERARAEVNQAFGARTEFVTPQQVQEICPQIDLSGGGLYPVLGGTYHAEGATARHDRVVWAFAEGAMRAGVHVLQKTQVTGLVRDGDDRNSPVIGVETTRGRIGAGRVLSAVGGHATTLASMAGIRLPIRTHPLQAFVTNHYENELGPIVSSSDLLFYASQTARGEMLLGAEIDRQPTYTRRSGHAFLQQCSFRAMCLLPFLRELRVLRQWAGICDMTPDYSPVLGATPTPGFFVSTGWGTWGFKAIPAGGEQMAALLAEGKAPDLIAPFSLDRFAADRTLADRGSAGTH